MKYRSDMFRSEELRKNDKNFWKIVDFYLFNCPVEDTSVRAITFEEQGWKGNWFSTYKAQMLKRASVELRSNYHPCKKEELDVEYDRTENYKDVEYCIFLKHDEKRVIESLYSAIRNAFAHGSFTIHKHRKKGQPSQVFYFFANYDGYLKAMINLSESTLLAWIDLFYSNPEEVRREKK